MRTLNNYEFKDFKEQIDKLSELKNDKFKINSDPGSATYQKIRKMNAKEIESICIREENKKENHGV